MEKNHLPRKKIIKQILLISIFISLISIGVQTYSNQNIPISIVSAQEDSWILRLQITETSGRGATVVLKGSPNASDGQDDLDIPIPPPPMPPYVRAWFTTPFALPFNSLLNESKHFPSARSDWNLSIIWVPELENDSLTSMTITWDPSQAIHSTFDSFQVFERNVSVADLLTEDHYSFPSNGSIHHFQIIGQSSPTNNTTGQSELPVLPILLSISVIIIVILIVFFIYHKREERRRMEEVRRRMEEERKMEEKRRMDEERRREKKGETKKKRTKKETGKK